MLPIKTLVVLSLVLGASAFAQTEVSKCGDLNREIELSDIACLANEVLEASFPEVKTMLEGLKDGTRAIQVRKFASDEVYVRIRNADDGVSLFAIDVNPKLYHSFLPVRPRPTLRAVRGIIAREMVEARDLSTLTFLERAKLLKNKFTDRVGYERNIDERAFEMGYATDIAIYRTWLYDQLDEANLKKVQKRFYTPDEINEWILRDELARPVH
ncbi:MAG: hypothetical protein JST80_10580 [Bdellovibrionales bacterium]|nr:hypothetical protein [Bdellovibrionales bacterium]